MVQLLEFFYFYNILYILFIKKFEMCQSNKMIGNGFAYYLANSLLSVFINCCV